MTATPDMPRILCVGPVMPPIHGQSLAFTRLCENLSGFELTVLDSNVTHLKSHQKIFHNLSLISQIIQHVRQDSYDLIYFTCSRSLFGSLKDIILLHCARRKKIKVLNHLHGSDFDDFYESCPKWYQRFLKHSYLSVDTSIVLLDAMRQQFKSFPHMKTQVLSNFYDEELCTIPEIDDSIESFNKIEGDIHILYLSNIMSTKGIFELIDACKALFPTYPHLHLHIAGHYLGDEAMTLEQVTRTFQQSISQCFQITHWGPVYGDTKKQLLQKSDLFILASYYQSEAFPISLIEAMACGNAIITTDYKYLPSVIGKQNGLLVKPKSVESLKKAIKTLLQSPQLMRDYQEYNRIHARENYSLATYIQGAHNIMQALISKE